MRKLLLLFLLPLIVFLLGGCVGDEPTVLREDGRIDLNSEITIGNSSWIPINKNGEPSDYVREILSVMDEFEKKYPDVEIVFWNLERNQDTYSRRPKIFGIWVYHRPQ